MILCNISIHLFQRYVLVKHHLWDLFLAAGEKGKRYSLPNSRIMVHQPSAGFQGQATDIQIHAKEILSLKERLIKFIQKHTGKSVDEISDALERDNFMTADEAKKFGLIDCCEKKKITHNI